MSQANLERLKQEANRATDVFLSEWPAEADDGLYAPIHYLMSLGGKRLRAVWALAAAMSGQQPLAVPPAWDRGSLCQRRARGESTRRRPGARATWDGRSGW